MFSDLIFNTVMEFYACGLSGNGDDSASIISVDSTLTWTMRFDCGHCPTSY